MRKPGRPSRPPRSNPALKVFLIVILLGVVAGGIYFARNPYRLAEIIHYVHRVEPEIQWFSLEVEGKETKATSGQTVDFHPYDRVNVLGFKSNRWYNIELTLVSPDIELGLLTGRDSLYHALGEEAFLQPRTFRLQVKEKDRVVGEVKLHAAMTTFDWRAKAAQAKESRQKILYYRQVLGLEPEDEKTRERLAALLKETGDLAESAKEFETLYKSEQEIRFLKELLTIYRAEKNHLGITRTYQRLIEKLPADQIRSYLEELASYYEENNHPEFALKIYQRLAGGLSGKEKSAVLKKIGALNLTLEKMDEALEAYREAAELNSDDRSVYVILARLYDERGDRPAYMAALTRILELDPDDNTVRRAIIDGLLEDGDGNRAEDHLRVLLAHEPQDVAARLQLIDILEKRGDVVPEIEEYEYLVSIDPDNKVLHYNLGVLYYDLDDMVEAEERMKSVALLDKTDVEARHYLFNLYQRQNRSRESTEIAMNLAELEPDQTYWHDIVFEYFDSKKKYKKLAETAEKWTKADPGKLDHWERLGYANLKLDRMKKAATAYEHAVRLAPGETRLKFKLANIYEWLGQLEKSLALCEKILSEDPDYYGVRDMYIRVRLKLLKAKHRK